MSFRANERCIEGLPTDKVLSNDKVRQLDLEVAIYSFTIVKSVDDAADKSPTNNAD